MDRVQSKNVPKSNQSSIAPAVSSTRNCSDAITKHDLTHLSSVPSCVTETGYVCVIIRPNQLNASAR